jgi:hypothetical protein
MKTTYRHNFLVFHFNSFQLKTIGMAHLSEYIKKTFNQPNGSNFLIRAEGKVIYLHSYIMKSIPYFETFFSSGVTKDKSNINCESYFAAYKLSHYIYTGEFEIENSTSPEEFFDLVELTESWQLPKEIKAKQFMYLYSQWKQMLKQNIENANYLCLHFENEPEVSWRVGNDLYVTNRFWSGKKLIAHIEEFLVANYEEITREMIDGPAVKLLGENARLGLYVKFGLYEKLNEYKGSLEHFSDFIDAYYDPKSRIFTLNQLSALKTSILHKKNNKNDRVILPHSKSLLIESFLPFRAYMYTYIGFVEDQSKDAMRIKCNVLIKKSNIVYFDDIGYRIKSIHWNDEELDIALPGETYSIALEDCAKLPDKNRAVFTVDVV